MANVKDILIVEDTMENVVFISQILEDNGYQYRTAKNGAEALEQLKRVPPDLVLLDIMMPRKSGIQVFKEMKKDPQLQSIPIIFVTGAGEVTGVNLQSGCEQPKDSYSDDLERAFGQQLYESMKGLEPQGLVTKPIDPPVLVRTIGEALA